MKTYKEVRLIDANELLKKAIEMRTEHGLCYAVRTTDIWATPTIEIKQQEDWDYNRMGGSFRYKSDCP